MNMTSRTPLLALFTAPVLACAQAPVPDLFNLTCPDDIRVEGCLGGGLEWTSEGSNLTGPGTTTWHSSSHLRLRHLASPDSTTWEYIRYCDPWPVASQVFDTLRIIRYPDGSFAENSATPYRQDDWKVAGVRRSRRPLAVADTLSISAADLDLPRKLWKGCIEVYHDRIFTTYLLHTTDFGPEHHYAWTRETGLLYMIVPEHPSDDETQQVVQLRSTTKCFKQIRPSGDGRTALVKALSERARALTR